MNETSRQFVEKNIKLRDFTQTFCSFFKTMLLSFLLSPKIFLLLKLVEYDPFSHDHSLPFSPFPCSVRPKESSTPVTSLIRGFPKNILEAFISDEFWDCGVFPTLVLIKSVCPMLSVSLANNDNLPKDFYFDFDSSGLALLNPKLVEVLLRLVQLVEREVDVFSNKDGVWV
jgi:hypothetical protein